VGASEIRSLTRRFARGGQDENEEVACADQSYRLTGESLGRLPLVLLDPREYTSFVDITKYARMAYGMSCYISLNQLVHFLIP
jgi:hypothetical protein